MVMCKYLKNKFNLCEEQKKQNYNMTVQKYNQRQKIKYNISILTKNIESRSIKYTIIVSMYGLHNF